MAMREPHHQYSHRPLTARQLELLRALGPDARAVSPATLGKRLPKPMDGFQVDSTLTALSARGLITLGPGGRFQDLTEAGARVRDER